jgi:hypothetical protein
MDALNSQLQQQLWCRRQISSLNCRSLFGPNRHKQDRASGGHPSSVLALPIVHVMAPARTHHRSIGFHGPLVRHEIP